MPTQGINVSADVAYILSKIVRDRVVLLIIRIIFLIVAVEQHTFASAIDVWSLAITITFPISYM